MTRWIGWNRSSTEAATRTIGLLAVIGLLSAGALTQRLTPRARSAVVPSVVTPLVNAPAAKVVLPATVPSVMPPADSVRRLANAPPQPDSTTPKRVLRYRRSAQVLAALKDLRARDLLLPLPDLLPDQLRDSFLNDRDGGARRHYAIDMPAPTGTPVLSVAAGTVLDLRRSASGGISLFVADTSGKFIFYYAHLQKYHPRMQKGLPLLRGDTIGFVGTSGNAPENMPHLHFAILLSSSLARWPAGTPINPAEVWRKQAPADSKMDR